MFDAVDLFAGPGGWDVAARGMGLHTVGLELDAADYGLGQHRRRAILVASRTRDVHLPEPSHGPGLFTQPHIAMADVINWGYTQRPAPTVTGGGTATGGAEPFGNGTRRAMRAATGTPAWSGHPRGVTRPTIAECAALQGFPADYPWQGRAGQQYLQVGNAVPPLLAAAVLTAATGITTAAPATLLAA